jgi:hypothetical protein
MPPQDRVRCDDARDLTQDLPAQPMPDHQPASIVIGELKPRPTQLASKDPIFPRSDTRPLGARGDPTSQSGQHYLESERVDHAPSLYHGAASPHRCLSIQSWDITRGVVCLEGHHREGASAEVKPAQGWTWREWVSLPFADPGGLLCSLLGRRLRAVHCAVDEEEAGVGQDGERNDRHTGRHRTRLSSLAAAAQRQPMATIGGRAFAPVPRHVGGLSHTQGCVH